MYNRKNLGKDTYLVKYSSNDGRTYGVMAVGYCNDEQQAISKSKKDLMRTNPKAADFNFAATRE